MILAGATVLLSVIPDCDKEEHEDSQGSEREINFVYDLKRTRGTMTSLFVANCSGLTSVFWQHIGSASTAVVENTNYSLVKANVGALVMAFGWLRASFAVIPWIGFFPSFQKWQGVLTSLWAQASYLDSLDDYPSHPYSATTKTKPTMASSTGSVISQALHGITGATIDDLSRLRTKIQELRTKLLEMLELEDNRTERLLILRVGIKACHNLKTSILGQPADYPPQGADASLHSLQFFESLATFITQTQRNSFLSDATFQDWEKRALTYLDTMAHLDTMRTKLAYISLHAKLIEEWSCSGGIESIPESFNEDTAQSSQVGALHTIFLHYIGVRWSIFWKEALASFISWPGPWLKSQPDFSTYCGSKFYVPYVRDEFHRKHSFVSRLIDLPKPGEQEKRDHINGRTDAEQKIFQILPTEIAVNVRLHGEFTVLRSSFRRWDDLLPHKTVHQILRFFGVSEKWLGFFLTFLEAPLRGMSPSHVLGDVFGEVVLFCLDMAVNQATRGGLLHRSFTDLCFWSHSQEQVVTAWATIQKFATVTGTQICNHESGCVRLHNYHNPVLPVHQPLPQGDIKWGVWRLSPSMVGFEIDHSVIGKYVTKLRTMLENKQTSIISLIKTWNSHVENLTSMFALPAKSMGQGRLEIFIETHSRIQRMLFKQDREDDGDGIFEGFYRFDDHVKALLKQRYGMKDVSNAYLFFPVELGGLGLNSPIIWLCTSLHVTNHSPSYLLEKSHKEEDRQWLSSSAATLVDVYGKLLETPFEMSTLYDKGDLRTFLRGPNKNSDCQWGIDNDWGDDIGDYWRRILQHHGAEAVEKFGGLELLDMELLPSATLKLVKERLEKEGTRGGI
ncbi:uncharacterized protein PG986_010570 [Apiospora aurea]|uniref:Uncharacterized protein n=1 Tax=Apiospora aurea TaxID=335848 RepID=A0ABR1Q2M7_9PEZI